MSYLKSMKSSQQNEIIKQGISPTHHWTNVMAAWMYYRYWLVY